MNNEWKDNIKNRIEYLEGLRADLQEQMKSLGEGGKDCTAGQLMMINREISFLINLLSDTKNYTNLNY